MRGTDPAREILCRYADDHSIPGTADRFGDNTWTFLLDKPGARREAFVVRFDRSTRTAFSLPSAQKGGDASDVDRLTDPRLRSWLIAIKEFVYARLFERPAQWTQQAVMPATANGDVQILFYLTRFLVGRGVPSFSAASQSVIADFARVIGQKYTRLEYLQQITLRVQSLWDYREYLSYPLSFDPVALMRRVRRLRSVSDSSQGEDWSPRENATSRIPEPVMLEIGGAALRYVERHSHEIIEVLSTVCAARESVAERYGETPEARKAHPPYQAYRYVAKAALRNLPERVIDPNDRGWAGPRTLATLRREVTLLRAACWIVIAWLTAMRPPEIAAIKRGSFRLGKSKDGLTDRAFITSRRFKGKGVSNRDEGDQAEWVTVPEIEIVFRILEDLVRLDFESSGTEYLLPSRLGSVRLRGARPSDRALRVSSLNGLLRDFQRSVTVPGSDAANWPLSPRQFRRTAAWWFVRRPFGEVAGKEHFKHASIAVFEGYVGRDPEFRELVRDEELIYNIDLLEEVRQDVESGGVVAGPGGYDFTEQIRARSGETRADEWKHWVHHIAQQMYPGALNICIFDRVNALCLQTVPVEQRNRPVMIRCQQDQCKNSKVGLMHLPMWLLQLDEIEKALAEPRLASNKRQAHQSERQRILKTIGPLITVGLGRVGSRLLCDLTEPERSSLDAFRVLLLGARSSLEGSDGEI